MKLIEKSVPKTTLYAKLLILGWIILCNLFVLMLAKPLEKLGVSSWAIFLVNILFFLAEDVPPKKRLVMAGFGVVTGLAAAAGMSTAVGALEAAGLPGPAAAILPLSVVLAVIIIGNAYMPLVFNNIGFAYFCVSMIRPERAVSDALPNIIAGLAGNLFLNISCLLIARFVKRRRT